MSPDPLTRPDERTLAQQALAHQRQGRFTEAIACYRQILALNPTHAEVHCQLGLMLCVTGHVEAGMPCFQEAIRLKPTLADAHANLAMAYFSQRCFPQAEAACRTALSHDPTLAKAHLHLGKALSEQGRFQEAMPAFQEVLRLQPNHVEAFFGLGLCYQTLGQFKPAVDYYQQALRQKPDFAEAHNNMGNILKRVGRLPEAIAAYERAIAAQPGYTTAYSNLGLAYQEQLKLEPAYQCFQKAAELNPTMPDAYRSMGDALTNLVRIPEAEAAYEKAMALQPNDGLRVKMAVMFPPIVNSTEEIHHWRARYLENIRQLQHTPLQIRNPVQEVGTITFFLAYHGLNNKPIQEEVGKLFAALPLWTHHVSPRNKKPRLGIISRYFVKDHTMWHVYRGLLDKLSREVFDITIFTVGVPVRLPVAEPFQQVNLPVSDLAQARDAVAAQNLDILLYLDIGMDPLTYYLAYNRLARLQCVTWGHPDTTGISTLDAFISSRLFETADAQTHYTEHLALLEGIPTYYYRPELTGPPLTREDLGFRSHEHLYLCPQTLIKFHPDFDPMLAAILERDPQGVLLLANAAYPEWTQLMMRRFARRIPHVAERIRILDPRPHPEFLQLLTLADVMIDTPYFGGGRTTYEALALGTPIVTMPTAMMSGRMAAGCYHKMGLTECIADSPEAYADLAVNIATEPERRADLKARILETNPTLYEDLAVVRELETLLLTLWEQAPS